MLLDYLRGRPALPNPNPAPEVTPVGEDAYRVALGGEVPVTVTAAPVSLDDDEREAPAVQVVAFALSAADARGAVTARLIVGPAQVMQNYLVRQGYVTAGATTARLGGLKGMLYRVDVPAEPDARQAVVPLVVALARAAAHMAAARGAGTLLVVRAWLPEREARRWRPAEEALDAAYTAAGFRLIEGDSSYGYASGGAVWGRRGMPARRGGGAPGFVIPLSTRDAAWFDGVVRACRTLGARSDGTDDGVESAVNAIERWRLGRAARAETAQAEAELRDRITSLSATAFCLGLAALNALAVALHREDHLGKSELDHDAWREMTDSARRSLFGALLNIGEPRQEAAVHVAAWLGEEP